MSTYGKTIGSGGGGGTVPTGTGFTHITSSAQDPAAKAVDLSSSDVTNSLPAARVSGLGTAIDSQDFTASGTWTKPTNAKTVRFWLIGTGGPGGSGARQPVGTLAGGGGGGASGSGLFYECDADMLPATLTVTIGAAGTPGASVTTNATNGNAGTAGGATTVTSAGSFSLTAPGGNGGAAGTSAGAGAGGAAPSTGTGTAINGLTALAGIAGGVGGVGGGHGTGGGAGNTSASGGPKISVSGSGGGGGGISATEQNDTGVTGGQAPNLYDTRPANGAAGAPNGGNGGNSTSPEGGGSGGGSGATSVSAAGGTGGAGGTYGSGGGGGGGARNTFASGAGGAGGLGFARVQTVCSGAGGTGGGATAPSGTGYTHNTGGVQDGASKTPTQVTADLNLFTNSLQGLTPASGGGTTNYLRADGSWSAPAGSGGTTPTGTGYAHITSGAQDGAAKTPTQVTADLNLVTSSLQGMAPASGGGTTNFLRADGTWAAPPGGGGSTPTGTGVIHVTGGSQDAAAQPLYSPKVASALGDSSVTVNPGTDGASRYVDATTLTANRTITVGAGGSPPTGLTAGFVRTSTDANTLTIANGGPGGTGAGNSFVFAGGAWPSGVTGGEAFFEWNGTDWIYAGFKYVVA